MFPQQWFCVFYRKQINDSMRELWRDSGPIEAQLHPAEGHAPSVRRRTRKPGAADRREMLKVARQRTTRPGPHSPEGAFLTIRIPGKAIVQAGCAQPG